MVLLYILKVWDGVVIGVKILNGAVILVGMVLYLRCY